MVRHAIETAVSASISTPVCPVTFTVARTRKPGSEGWGWISISTLVIGNGWHSGMSSCVRFAAMMPASRAAPSTSPFAALPLRMRSSVAFFVTTRPSATARRPVVGLADTSTMCASPRPVIWLSFLVVLVRAADFLSGFFLALAMALFRGMAAGGALKQGPRRRRNVVLLHQAFADQECRDADRRQSREI